MTTAKEATIQLELEMSSKDVTMWYVNLAGVTFPPSGYVGTQGKWSNSQDQRSIIHKDSVKMHFLTYRQCVCWLRNACPIIHKAIKFYFSFFSPFQSHVPFMVTFARWPFIQIAIY